MHIDSIRRAAHAVNCAQGNNIERDLFLYYSPAAHEISIDLDGNTLKTTRTVQTTVKNSYSVSKLDSMLERTIMVL